MSSNDNSKRMLTRQQTRPDVIDKTIDRYILENDLLGKVPTTKQILEKNHLHDWINGIKQIVSGQERTICGSGDCPCYMLAGHRIIDPRKPKRQNYRSGRYN